MSDADFWDLAPIEYDALVKRHLEIEEIVDFRSARLAYVLYESNRDAKANPKPYTLDDFLLIKPKREKHSPEDLLLAVRALNDVMGGTVIING